MNTNRSVDVAIVGAGPCGLAVGAAARKAGLGTVLFDRGPLCASLVDYPPYMKFFSTPEKLEIEGLPFVTTDTNATRVEALKYYRGVARYFDLPVRQYETVVSVTSADGSSGTERSFRIDTKTRLGKTESWLAGSVVVATGGFHEANRLEIPGEELPKVFHEYREPHPYWNQDVLVVGGGNSAVEASLELYRAGARVTLVHFEGEVDSGVKPWVLPDINNRLENRDIDVYWHHRLIEVRPASIVLESQTSANRTELPNDWVFALTGWRPDPVLLGEIGVSVDPDTGVPEHDPDTMETPVPGVFIAGVLAAGLDANRIFIENGRLHGRSIMERILSTR